MSGVVVLFLKYSLKAKTYYKIVNPFALLLVKTKPKISESRLSLLQFKRISFFIYRYIQFNVTRKLFKSWIEFPRVISLTESL